MYIHVCAPTPSSPGGAAEAPHVGPSTWCSYRQRVTGRRAHLPFLGCQSRFRISTNIQPRYGPKGQAGSKALDNHCLALFPPQRRAPPIAWARQDPRLWITTAKPRISHSSPLGAGGRESEEARGPWSPKCQTPKKLKLYENVSLVESSVLVVAHHCLPKQDSGVVLRKVA